MEIISKEKIDELKKRAQTINNKIVEANTKKEIAQKRVKELLFELGYDNAETLSNDEILEIINNLEQKEHDKAAKFEEQIKKAEEILND